MRASDPACQGAGHRHHRRQFLGDAALPEADPARRRPRPAFGVEISRRPQRYGRRRGRRLGRPYRADQRADLFLSRRKLSPFEAWLLAARPAHPAAPAAAPHEKRADDRRAAEGASACRAGQSSGLLQPSGQGDAAAAMPGCFRSRSTEDIDIPAFVDALQIFPHRRELGRAREPGRAGESLAGADAGREFDGAFRRQPAEPSASMSDWRMSRTCGRTSSRPSKKPESEHVETMGVRDMKNAENSFGRGRRPCRSWPRGALADTTLKMVEVITSPPRTEFLKKQIAEFEAANPGVKVELVSLPWGQAFEKFLTMVQAGDTPDIVEMPERWMGALRHQRPAGGSRPLHGQLARCRDARRARQGVRLDGRRQAVHDPLRLLYPRPVLEQEAVQGSRPRRSAGDARRVRRRLPRRSRPSPANTATACAAGLAPSTACTCS